MDDNTIMLWWNWHGATASGSTRRYSGLGTLFLRVSHSRLYPRSAVHGRVWSHAGSAQWALSRIGGVCGSHSGGADD
jgi:hypothetical protein